MPSPSVIITIWDDPRNVEMLTTMWADRQSASQIADAIPGATRNSVLGKAHRLKLPNHGIPAGKSKPHGNKGQPRAKSIVAKAERRQREGAHADAQHMREAPFREGSPLPPDEAGVDVTRLIGVVDLTAHTCRWPHGTPGEAAFGFCGQEPVEGKPYCQRHMARAYHRPA